MKIPFMLAAGLVTVAVLQAPAVAEKASAPMATTENGWVPEAPPGVDVMGGYVAIVNKGTRTLTLKKAESPLFAEVQMHTVRKEDGRVRMEPISVVAIPAGATYRFAPGGDHLMLMKPKQKLKVGDNVPMTFDFGQDGRLTFTLPVKRSSEQHADHHGDHHDHQAAPTRALPLPPPWSASGDYRQRLQVAGLQPLRMGVRLPINFVVHLDVYYEGKPVEIPANVGIDQASRLVSPLHTHKQDGVISVESPEQKDFTLGQFFTVWGVPLDGAEVFVDGERVTDPSGLVLTPRQQIAVVYGARPETIPSTYRW